MTLPWWRVLRLREEVRAGAGNINDVQMSLYRAVYADPPALYAESAYYGSITHPTATLAGLLARIAIRLGGGDRSESVSALYHLDQGMGGGKSHGLIGLWHLARNPAAFAKTDIGQATWKVARHRLDGNEPKLDRVHVVVISADNMTPFSPDKRLEIDGPAETLWERLLWRLVGPDYLLFNRYKDRSDQEGIKEALASLGRPILILVDEIMEYVRRLDDDRYSGRRNDEFAFLKALLDAVNDVPHVAMVVVMIATDRDPAVYGPLALVCREELLANLVRNGTTATVTEAGDFAEIIRRRLFDEPASPEVLASLVSQFAGTSPQWRALLSRVPGTDPAMFATEIARSYPFHPDLLRLVETEWAILAGYQRVRSTVSIFAQTTYFWIERASRGEWVPQLVGPGDLPLEHSDVREALLDSGIIESDTTVANYRQVIATDVVGDGGAGGIAANLDRLARVAGENWYAANPRAAQRMATALLLYSLAARAAGRIGATDVEIKAASYVPDARYAFTDAETIFNELTDAERGLGSLELITSAGGQPQRYHLTTLQTLQMLYRQQHNAVTEVDRDAEVARVAEHELRSGGGFAKARFLRDEPDARGQQRPDRDILADLDENNLTRLVALDPRRWTLLNGRDDETRRAIDMVFGVGADAMPVTHAASLVIACVNTQRRDNARLRAAEFLAWNRVARVPVVATNPSQRANAERNIAAAKLKLEQAVRRAFQHYAYLHRDTQDELRVVLAKFDEDGRSALSGANVWDKLVERARAVGQGGLSGDVLLHYLRHELPRSLAEVTALFWTNPRLPMLSNVAELRRALHAALTTRKLELVRSDGAVADPPDRPENVPINSAALLVRVPIAVAPPVDLLAELLRSLQGKLPRPLADIVDFYSSDSPLPALADTDALRQTLFDALAAKRLELARPDGAATDPPDRPENLSLDSSTLVLRLPTTQPGPRADRAELRVRVRASLSEDTRRDEVVALLTRLMQDARLGDIESIDFTINLIGIKSQLTGVADMARRIEGTQPRMEDLPD